MVRGRPQRMHGTQSAVNERNCRRQHAIYMLHMLWPIENETAVGGKDTSHNVDQDI